MVVLRNFQITDLEEIEVIERKAFPEGPYENELLRHIFTDRHSMNEIALVEGRVAGYIVALLMDEHNADIENIAVDPDQGRKGIGSVLLESMEKKLQAVGIRRIMLEVRDKNTEAIDFYGKHGYKVMDYIRNYYVERYRGSRSAYRMIKVLNSPAPA